MECAYEVDDKGAIATTTGRAVEIRLPWGGPAWPKTAEKPSVLEFESPKLKIAGNLHEVEAKTNDIGAKLDVSDTKVVTTCILEECDSIGNAYTHRLKEKADEKKWI